MEDDHIEGHHVPVAGEAEEVVVGVHHPSRGQLAPGRDHGLLIG